jgi:uncharacterized ion transporter superfamily protein YfcC
VINKTSNKERELTFIQKIVLMVFVWLFAVFLLGMIGITSYLNILISSMMIALLFYRDF